MSLRNIQPHELENYTALRLTQYGVPEAAAKAKASVAQLSEADKQEIASSYLVYEQDGQLVAGAGLGDGKYLQSVLFAEDETITQNVIGELLAKAGAVRFYVGSVPEKYRPMLEAFLNERGFVTHTLHEVSAHKTDLSQPTTQSATQPQLALTTAGQMPENELANIYQSAKHELDHSWEMVRDVMGGGMSKSNSFAEAETTTLAIVGVSEPEPNRKMYAISYLASKSYSTAELLDFLHGHLHLQDNDLITHHTTSQQLQDFLGRGYKVTKEEVYLELTASI